MDWVRPELLLYKPLWIANNQQTIVINFHQDFWPALTATSSKDSAGGALLCWNNCFEKTQLSKQEEEEATSRMGWLSASPMY